MYTAWRHELNGKGRAAVGITDGLVASDMEQAALGDEQAMAQPHHCQGLATQAKRERESQFPPDVLAKAIKAKVEDGQARSVRATTDLPSSGGKHA